MALDALTGLVGVLLGWLLNWFPGWWDSRPKLKAQVVQLVTFPATMGRDGRWRMVVPDGAPNGSEAESVMFWVVDLIVQNQSAADDAITEIVCHLQLSQQWASTRVGSRFFGQNLHGHSLHHLHLVFDFEKVNFGTTEAWQRDQKLRLALSSMNGQAISLPLDPSGTGMAVNPGQDMNALVAVE